MVGVSHAVQLDNGSFAVCHGSHEDPTTGVSIVDVDGRLVADTVNGPRRSAVGRRMTSPRRLAVNGDGTTFVTDVGSRRILRLSPALFNVEEMMSGRRHDVGIPFGLNLDRVSERLYVADFRNGSVGVLQVKGVYN